MDLKEIKLIYKFLKNTDISELEVEDTRGKLSIKRGVVSTGVAPAVMATSVVTPTADADASNAPKEESSNIKEVTSPMVGTFYLSPSPEAAQFVELGALIKKGQTVCIVEAMKMMNEVESELSGKVVKILVENGQPVEYGEPLFHVEI
ncbi:MAG: acetyl-CoA carboxylase biotin carboxyl carrier protein [Deltaproteobacteria bacterium]|nr:acetyl-CoA carboxylase biotin carboxyl carrier protein [Deltaproteobacteria bacterium]